MPYTELMHFNILGAKWGRRRFQYPDGSLTPAGRKRYGVGPPRESTKVTETERRRYNVGDSFSENKPQPKKLTRDEMNEYIRERNTEKTYEKLKKEERGPSTFEFTKSFLDDAAKTAEWAKKWNSQYIKNNTLKKRLDLTGFTDQELRTRINRELLERQYNDLFSKSEVKVAKGQKVINTILDYAGPVLSTSSSIASLAILIQKVMRKE